MQTKNQTHSLNQQKFKHKVNTAPFIPTCRHAKFSVGTAKKNNFLYAFHSISFRTFNQLIENEEKKKRWQEEEVTQKTLFFVCISAVWWKVKDVFFWQKKT